MFKYRAISFPILLSFLWAMFFWKAGGSYLFLIGSTIMVTCSMFEYAKLMNKLKVKNFPGICAGFLGVFSLAYSLFLSKGIDVKTTIFMHDFMMMLVCFIIVAPWFLLLFGQNKMYRKVLGSFALILSLGIPLILLQSLYFIPLKNNISLLFFVILTTKAMDTGGYIFGILTSKLPGGNHKIAPSISPNKSWEGTIGGILFSVGVSLLFWKFCNYWSLNVHIFIGVVLALCSFFGDLTESALKRAAQVKDSGNWIPGMGGALDVLDSFIYVGIAISGIITFSNILSL